VGRAVRQGGEKRKSEEAIVCAVSWKRKKKKRGSKTFHFRVDKTKQKMKEGKRRRGKGFFFSCAHPKKKHQKEKRAYILFVLFHAASFRREKGLTYFLPPLLPFTFPFMSGKKGRAFSFLSWFLRSIRGRASFFSSQCSEIK